MQQGLRGCVSDIHLHRRISSCLIPSLYLSSRLAMACILISSLFLGRMSQGRAVSTRTLKEVCLRGAEGV
jgi:hypothetical protein